MRSEAAEGKWATVTAAALIVFFTCTPPQTGNNPASPTPPSPTPTTPLQASSAPFHGGEVGVAYATVGLTATGGVAPYKWTLSAGALPGGLVLGNDGSVSGNPTSAGTFSFTIQAADAGDSTAILPGVITIAPALSASLIPSCAQYCRVELGCVSVCGAFGQQGGGVSPYAYTLTQGPLPAGTSLSGLSLTGTFVGQSGYLKFTVQVSDAMGAGATIAPTFWMYDHISLAGATCSYVQLPCYVKLPYSGGTPNVQVTLRVGGWAPGQCYGAAPSPCPQPPISGSASGGNLTVTIGPVPPNSYPYPIGTFTLSITDLDLCSSGTYCASGNVSVPLVWTG